MHLLQCPDTSVPEEQVDSIGDVHQVVDPTNLSMHAVQACNLIGQVGLDEIVAESPVELFVAFLPFDKGISKILTGHFDLRVPLVGRCAARGSVFVEGRVRRPSHHVVGERRCFTPAVYVDNAAQFVNGGVRLGHNSRMAWAQELMTSSLTGHGTRRDGKKLWVEFGILCRKWIVFVRPKSTGWLHSERAQVSEFVDSMDFMFQWFHIIWLPQPFWSTNSIVAGRWSRPTLCGVGIVLVVIDALCIPALPLGC